MKTIILHIKPKVSSKTDAFVISKIKQSRANTLTSKHNKRNANR